MFQTVERSEILDRVDRLPEGGVYSLGHHHHNHHHNHHTQHHHQNHHHNHHTHHHHQNHQHNMIMTIIITFIIMPTIIMAIMKFLGPRWLITYIYVASFSSY